jgi:hypothetical protein
MGFYSLVRPGWIETVFFFGVGVLFVFNNHRDTLGSLFLGWIDILDGWGFFLILNL